MFFNTIESFDFSCETLKIHFYLKGFRVSLFFDDVSFFRSEQTHPTENVMW